MKKSEIKILLSLEEGKTPKDLEKELRVSKSYLSKTLKSLLEKGFIKVERRGKRKFYSLAENPFLELILKILRKNPRILEGKREILLAKLNEPKSLAQLQAETNLSLKQILEYLKEFQSLGITEKTNGKFRILDKDVERLAELLRIKKGIVWEKGKECLIESEKPREGSLTAFSLFPSYNLKIFPDRFYYYYPKKRLSIEEIFIHSLKFSKTQQQLILATLFYLKNKYRMEGSKLKILAKKYQVSFLLNQIFQFLTKKECSLFSYKEFMEKAKEYGITLGTPNTKAELKNFFKELDKKLEKKVKLYLIGGANMVLKNMKISTKDIDVIVEKNLAELKKGLISMGFKFSENIFEKKNLRIDLFVKRVLGGYRLSKRMKKDAEPFYLGNKLEVYLLSNEDVFLLKTYAGREGDLEDCKILAEKGLDWNKILQEALEQEKQSGKLLSISLLDTLDDLYKTYKIRAPILRFLEHHCTKNLLKIVLKEEKTVKELVSLLEKPEPTIRKILKELEKEGEIVRIKKGRVFKFKKRKL